MNNHYMNTQYCKRVSVGPKCNKAALINKELLPQVVLKVQKFKVHCSQRKKVAKKTPLGLNMQQHGS